MANQWKWTAALLLCGFGYFPVGAQYLPLDSQPAQIIEPLPEAASCTSPAMLGPLNPLAAPPGPPDCLSLPSNIPTAFQESLYGESSGMYLHGGVLFLQRQRLANMPLAVFDQGSFTRTITTTDPVTGVPVVIREPSPILVFGDSGNPPPSQGMVAQNLNSLQPDMQWGVKLSAGIYSGNSAVEMGGFYVPNDTVSLQTIAPNLIDVFFFNPPPGFEGINGLWLQADRLLTTYRASLLNLEMNYRFLLSDFGCDVLLGIRYFDLQERIQMVTTDLPSDELINIIDPDFDLLRRNQATYEVRTHNRFVAPQVGLEWYRQLFGIFDAGISAKGAWGINFTTRNAKLARADGLIGIDRTRNETIFSHLYELGGFVSVYFWDRCRVRGGYNCMWFVGVPDVVGQINFDLSNQLRNSNNNGSIYFHGPSVELQLLF
ncbi:MAG: hypothetical protein ACK4RK_08285 [Gemmataceae bacterium]